MGQVPSLLKKTWRRLLDEDAAGHHGHGSRIANGSRKKIKMAPRPQRPSNSLSLHRMLMAFPRLQDTIDSFLDPRDVHAMMESSRGLSLLIGRSTQSVAIHFRYQHFTPSSPFLTGRDVVKAFLRRRPQLQHITIKGHTSLAGLLDVLNDGSSCQQSIESVAITVPDTSSSMETILSLLRVLACSCLRLSSVTLALDSDTDAEAIMLVFGAALQARSLRQAFCGLRSLHLNLNGENISGELSSVLCSGSCHALEELHLQGVRLDMQAGEELCSYLMETATTSRLRSLTLEGPLREEIIKALISSDPMVPGLQSLVLHEIDPRDLLPLLRHIAKKSWPALQRLQLTVDISDDEGDCSSRSSRDDGERAKKEVAGLMTEILLCCQGMKSFGLVDYNLGPEGGIAIAHALQMDGDGVARLEELNLHGMGIGYEGMTALARCLGHHGGAVRRLNLCYNSIGPDGIRELSEAFISHACPHLEHLDVSHNFFRDKGVMHLARAMEKGCLPKLKALYLNHVGMTDAGALALAEALRRTECKSLEQLRLVGGNDVSDLGMRQLVEVWGGMETRHSLQLGQGQEDEDDEYYYLEDG